jgi:chromosome segregation ATPase
VSEELLPTAWESIATATVVVSLYFFRKYNAQIERRVDEGAKRFELIFNSHEEKQKEIRNGLNRQKDELIESLRQINIDFFEFEKKLSHVKEDILKGAVATERACITLTEQSLKANDLGREIDNIIERVTEIDGKLKQLNLSSADNTKDIENIKRVLAHFKAKINGV